jgi:hypothetical protein
MKEIIMNENWGYSPLKLKAVDQHDVEVCSMHLQDALCPLSSMHYSKKDKVFSLMANRFCWENIEYGDQYSSYFRVHCGVFFHGVESIYKCNFYQKGHERIFNLLMLSDRDLERSETNKSKDSLSLEKEECGMSLIHLIFSDEKEIRLQGKKIEIYLKDFDEPWPSKHKPVHIFEHFEPSSNQGNESYA